MNWLNSKRVLAIHRKVMQRALQEDNGLRDNGDILDSALRRPENLFYYEGVNDIFELASVYCVAIAVGHPFNNGNKRTATLAMTLFLIKNGYRCRLPVTKDTALYIAKVAQSHIDYQELSIWLRESIIQC